MAYEKFKISELLSELKINSEFAALAADQQLQFVNSAIQGAADLSNDAEKDYYRTNLSGGTLGIATDYITIAGTGGIGTNPATSFKGLAVDVLRDTIYSYFGVSIIVPKGATAINSINLFVRRQQVGNLYLKFSAAFLDLDALPALPSEDAEAAFSARAIASSDGKIQAISVPAAAFDGLIGLSEGDIVGVAVERDAANVADTYSGDLEVVGFEIKFNTVG